MRLEKGDMWEALETADLFCITTNAQTRADGALVMGRGIAAQAVRRFPKLRHEAGAWLRHRDMVGKAYGLAVLHDGIPATRPHPFALFQVKYHWRDEASTQLIQQSVAALTEWCEDWYVHYGEFPDAEWPNVHLNFPGIGNGRLSRDAVLPLLEPLPDCVTVWEYAGRRQP